MKNYKIKGSVLMIILLSLVKYDGYSQALNTKSKFPKNLTMGVHYQVQEFQLINQSFGSDCNCDESLNLSKRSLQTLNVSGFGTLDKRWALGFNLGFGSGSTLDDSKQYKSGDYFQTKFDVFYQFFNTGDKLRPYLTSSMQLALNSKDAFFSVPIGAGLRFSLKNGTFLNLQTAYDAGITKTLAKNLISTVGIHFPIVKAKVAQPEKVEAPPVVPEVIKPLVDTTPVVIKPIEPAPAPKIFKLAVKGSLNNELSKAKIPKAKVSLINNTTNTIVNDSSDINGNFYFPLEKDTKYTIKTRRGGYLPDSLKLNTIGITESDTLQTSFALAPLVKGKTIRLDNIFYDLGKDNIKKEAAKILDELELLLRENPTMQIELSSHTDSRGKDVFNLALSQRRAQSAVNYLVSKGILKSRMVAKGYGKTKLINKCTSTATCSEEEHQKNRRTEFTILKL